MKILRAILLLFSFSAALTKAEAQQVYFPDNVPSNAYVPGAIIFKLKEQYAELLTSPQGISSLQKGFDTSEISQIKQAFPTAKKPRFETDNSGRLYADIRAIGTMHYSGTESLKSVLIRISRSGYFEWVQPRFIHQPMFTPNDPQIAQQYHHTLIKTFEAFDIEQGDTNVYIGITDAGIQFDHQDLGNVRYNWDDPVNGVDDDNNGYIDDFRGWNTANNTNDPTATLSPHGMFTTGMSSATVNNGIGVAGNGYRCKFVPVRIDDANGFSFGYEGIVYLAELGCKIINASWGGTFPDPFGEEIVRYATVNKEALIVAAAGNSGLNEKYYPASFDGVFSVAATGSADVAWSSSTFGARVDICAPGELVRSCWPFNGYEISSGTSFSAPLVTGAAALVKSHFPSYSAQQVAERLRITADTTIYALAGNASVTELLGSGRLNMLRALSDPERPSIHYVNTTAVNNAGDSFIAAGDTVTLIGSFFNYLAASQNLGITISTENPYIEIVSNNYTAGSIATLAAHQQNTPFVFRVVSNAPYNLDVLFKLRYSDASLGYYATEFLEIRLNKDYIDLTLSNVKTTITSRGSIGYNSDFAQNGIGIGYENSGSQIYSAGFMLGSSNAVADNVYADTLPGYDNDFVRQQAVKKTVNSDGSHAVSARFSTNAAGPQSLSVRQTAHAQSGNNYIELEYSIRNDGSLSTSAVSAGIFADWDVQDYIQNRCVYDAQNKLLYAYDESNSNLYFGIKVLSNQTANAYCFNNDGSAGSISLYDGFSNAEKFNALSGSLTRNNSQTGEISALLGASVGNIAAGDSAIVRFAILGGTSLQELTAAAQQAQLNYNLSVLQILIETNAESCSGSLGSVLVSSEVPGLAQVQLLDAFEAALAPPVLLAGLYNPGNLLPGAYFIEISFNDGTSTQFPFSIQNADPIEIQNITASSEIVALPNATVDFGVELSGNASLSWNFGDGNQASGAVVSNTFTSAGTYNVMVIAANATCADTSYISIEVGETVGNEKIKAVDFMLFPNPTNDFLYVSAPDELPINAEVIDASGKVVQTFSGNAPIDVRRLKNGIYLLRLNVEENTQQTLFIVSH
jgi:serine protease